MEHNLKFVKTYDELQPGDVLLIRRDLLGSEINAVDNLLSWDKTSKSSHTAIYLKEVNGKKLFLENIAGITEGEKTVSLNEGYKATDAQDCILHDSKKNDISNLDRRY